jgi:hypothetical protein
MAAVYPDSAPDLDQHTSPHIRQIGVSTPLGIEKIIPLQEDICVFKKRQEEILHT